MPLAAVLPPADDALAGERPLLMYAPIPVVVFKEEYAELLRLTAPVLFTGVG